MISISNSDTGKKLSSDARGTGSGTSVEIDMTSLESLAVETPNFERPTDPGLDQSTVHDLNVMNLPERKPKASLPSFVEADGSLKIQELRHIISNCDNREVPGAITRRDFNFLNSTTVTPLIEWATGTTCDQSEANFIASIKRGLSYELYTKAQASVKNALESGLENIARGLPSQNLPGQKINLRQLIKLDPAGTCLLLINIISPLEQMGVSGNAFARALTAFRDTCRQ